MAFGLQRPKPKKSDAYIIDVDDRLLVRPPAAIVKKNERFDICNLTDNDAELNLVNIGIQDPVPVPAHDWVEVHITCAPGAFQYGVSVAGRKAHGESDPVIIIDPPARRK